MTRSDVCVCVCVSGSQSPPSPSPSPLLSSPVSPPCCSSGRQTVFSPRRRGRTQCSLPPLPRLKTLLFISDTVWAIYRGWSSVLSRLLLFSLARSLRLSLPLCLLLSSSLSLSLSLSLAHILTPSIPGSLSLPPFLSLSLSSLSPSRLS